MVVRRVVRRVAVVVGVGVACAVGVAVAVAVGAVGGVGLAVMAIRWPVPVAVAGVAFMGWLAWRG